jgi:lysyl endopeptidase
MSKMRARFLAWAGLSVGLLACAGEEVPVASEAQAGVAGGPERAAVLEGIARLHAFLDRERPAAAMRAPVVTGVTEAELRSLDTPGADPRLVKVGLTRELATPVAFRQAGAFERTADGGFVWSVVLRSTGASAMRVGFAGVHLPDAADLYVYNALGDAKGPYQGLGPNGSGSFWSHTLAGDEVVVQVRHFGAAGEAELRATSLVITHVGHLTPRFKPIASPEAFCDTSDASNAECVEDASCHNVSAVATAKNAVALMLWPQGPYFYICSGGLIADSAGSGTPYFLTANHCISRARDAENLEAHFNFATDRCASDYPIACESWRDLVGHGVLGSTIVASGSSSDFTLLRLAAAPPSGTAFLGWTSTPIANTNGAALHRVSHPDGAPQAYTEQRVDTGAGTCSSLPRGNFIYSRDVVGATEGGSSGSPVVNAAGQIVGQLYGACGTNLGDVCDAGSNATVDGAFASYFGQVSGILGGGGASEVCTDGVDNDGDGQVDCADADCAADPSCAGSCTGGQRGDACDANADCCSNKCKGPPSSKTCR